MSVDQINQSIQLLREDLLNHSLYSKIKNINDLQKFVETHIFAVWDFMSLLKSLQSQLTCTNTPWLPNKNSKTAYLNKTKKSNLNFYLMVTMLFLIHIKSSDS
jgi:hypothetical protein